MKNSDRIVGGQSAPSMIPWQVYLPKVHCGGIVLDSCTVLSAAHCESSKGEFIRAGSRNNNQGGQKRYISKVITHDYYHSDYKDYDFEILKLSSPLTLSNDVKPACLPSSTWWASSSKARCFVSGWGNTGM